MAYFKTDKLQALVKQMDAEMEAVIEKYQAEFDRLVRAEVPKGYGFYSGMGVAVVTKATKEGKYEILYTEKTEAFMNFLSYGYGDCVFDKNICYMSEDFEK